ncbi:MAG: PEP-CTERM sorting domain-containing protein [Pseudomonadales bacterium]|nr:PEP-CTERM sorting domain-containing protein [Pseudomonadales bacterium]
MHIHNNYSIAAFVAFVAIIAAAPSLATVVSFGDLTYDDSNEYISHSNGTRYLNLHDAASLNYAQTITATSSGGIYEDYHIASQKEGYAFTNAFLGGPVLVDIIGTSQTFNLATSLIFDNGFFGDNNVPESDVVYFLSDEDNDYGFIEFVNTTGEVTLKDSQGDFAESDMFSSTGDFDPRHISWLLVDNSFVTVPEPSLLAFVAIGLFGIGTVRRKSRVKPAAKVQN